MEAYCLSCSAAAARTAAATSAMLLKVYLHVSKVNVCQQLYIFIKANIFSLQDKCIVKCFINIEQ